MTKATEHPEWLDDPRFKTVSDRVTNVVARLALTAEAVKTRTSSEWLELFDLHEVPCAPILSRDELLNFPQIIANELIVESEDPLMGPMRQARPSARFDKTPSQIRTAAPILGEHTDQVLQELGIDHSDIQELRAKHIVS